MQVTNTLATTATWIGGYLYGCKWSVREYSQSSPYFSQNLRDGKEKDWQSSTLQRYNSSLTVISWCDNLHMREYRLIAQDRHEEARDFFINYHANGDESHPLVTLQMTETLDALRGEPTSTWKGLFDLRVLFENRASRYRIMLNMTFAWFGQFSGNKYVFLSNQMIRDAILIANNFGVHGFLASFLTIFPSCSSMLALQIPISNSF